MPPASAAVPGPTPPQEEDSDGPWIQMRLPVAADAEFDVHVRRLGLKRSHVVRMWIMERLAQERERE